MMWDSKHHWGILSLRGCPVKLNPEWVEWVQFEEKERQGWVENKDTFVMLSSGDCRKGMDAPAHFFKNVPIKYPQIGATCAASSFASVLDMAGHYQASMNLQQHLNELGKGAGLYEKLVNIVNRSRPRNYKGETLLMICNNGYDILTGPTPALVVLKGSDNGIGHAISIHEEYIVDSTWPYALPRTMETLNWCCAPALFSKPRKAYVLKRPKIKK